MQRLAIVLLNLGGPDHPEAVRPFLFNLFNDPSIIALPGLIRTPLAYLIAKKRAPLAQQNYALMGGRSPILPNTLAQAEALQNCLDDCGEVRVFTCMRYWHPMSDEVAEQVKAFAPQRIVLLPLYPQFSTTTTASSLRVWKQSAARIGLAVPTQLICCYPLADGFVDPMVADIRTAYDEAQRHGKPRVLLSAHGLPEKIVRAGDPYQMQCEKTAALIVQKLNIHGLDWVSCYQSRVGPLTWIGPATEDEIKRAGRDRVPVIIVPIAFVSEHVETLVELDHEYADLAATCGVPAYHRIKTVSTAPAFIEALANAVREALSHEKQCAPAAGFSGCGGNFKRCACKQGRA